METSLQILNCSENSDGKLVWKDNKPCPLGGTDSSSSDLYLGIIGIFMLILYGILPYLFITIQLFRIGRPNKNTKSRDTHSTGYVLYGWAAEGCK